MFGLLLTTAVLMGGTTSIIAGAKGRRPFLWFGIGFAFNLFGLVAVCAMPKVEPPRRLPEPTREQAFRDLRG